MGETWHSDNETFEHIDGYDTHYTTHNLNRNDGLILYAKQSLNSTCKQIILGSTNALQLEFTAGGRAHSLLAVYRSPSTHCHTFIDALETYYSSTKNNTTYYLVGDINIDIASHLKDQNKDKYLDVLYNAGFTPCVESPTRVTLNTSTCIDHIFTTHYDTSAVTAAVLTTDITDHYAIGANIKHTTKTPDDHRYSHYLNMGRLNELLQTNTWEEVLSETNVHVACQIFLDKIKDCKDKSYEMKNTTTRYKKLKPWITVEIIKKIRTRDKLSKQVKKHPFDIDIVQRYTNLRKEINTEIKNTRITYYKNKIMNAQGNAKVFWGVINEISGVAKKKEGVSLKHLVKHEIISDENVRQTANKFNKYFAEVGQDLADKIKAKGPLEVNDADHRPECTMTLRQVSEEEVRLCVSGLRGGSAPGVDGITANILKENIDSLIRPLVHIINLSITSGTFPNSFKTAKVIPIYKSKEKSEYSNYRPISLLSVCAKVLEKCVKVQLQKYLETNKLLSNDQFGFREGVNSTDSLFTLNTNLINSINNNEKAMLCFIDLAKAFDTIDRKKLFKKLENLGINNNSLEWFKSYLTDRSQIVSIREQESDVEEVKYGVVQGSTLGPLLFLTYINNLTKIGISGKILLFADDTAIIFKGENWQDVFNTANQDLKKIKNWFDQNTLTMNVTKTKCLPIALRQSSEPPKELKLKLHTCDREIRVDCDCQEIERVVEYKYLGIICDNRLKWDKHILYIRGRLRKLVYPFKQMQPILSTKEIKTVYFAQAQSILQYGIIAWGGAFKTHLDKVTIAQKALLKIGFGKARQYSSDELYKETKVLTARQLFIKTLVTYIRFKHPLSLGMNTHNYPTRHALNLNPVVPRLRNTISLTNAFILAHTIMRNLPVNLRNGYLKIQAFKHKVTEWLLQFDERNVEQIISSAYR